MTGIIVAFPKAENAKNIKNILVRSGFRVLAACTSGSQVLQLAHEISGGIVICGFRLADMGYRELRESLPEDFDMLLISSKAQWQEGSSSGILYLSMPIKVHELISTAEMMVYTQERKRKKKKSQPKMRSKEEQEVIQQAKELLMARNNMTEEEAHRYMQKTSMNNGTSLPETAQMIISLAEA